jgi:hypothetical protein
MRTSACVYDLIGNRTAAANDYVYGLDLSGGLLSLTVNGEPATLNMFYAYDANGNVGQLLNAADGTEIKTRYEYDPYEKTLSYPQELRPKTIPSASPRSTSTRKLASTTMGKDTTHQDLAVGGAAILQEKVRP